jgi:ABC-type transport system involved in multi-copper enzyme maturation permease subunit
MTVLTLRAILRDRVLHALAVAAAVMFLLVPVFSFFSMRQVQELSISLALSSLSFILLVFSVLYGASSIWRDVERRCTAMLFGMPVTRGSYLLGKFLGVALFILCCTALLATVSYLVISWSAAQYPADIPVAWVTVMVAVAAAGLKYVLLVAVALLFSSLSTSFFLPVFGTLAIYFAGGAAQEVMEFVSGAFGQQLSPLSKAVIQACYYLLPNLAIFDFSVEAIYALSVAPERLIATLAYFAIYTSILLSLAVWCFSRRELP